MRMRGVWMIVGLSVLAFRLSAQERQLRLTIEEAMVLGQTQSVASMESRNNMLKAYWTFRNYKADRLPGISFSGTLPSLNRQLNSYQQEDGSYKFIPNNYLSEYLGLTVRQVIPFTGGEIYLESNLERMDQLGAGGTGSFLAVPFSVTLSQPLFAYNPYKWQKKIEPLRFEKSKSEYVANLENVNISTVSCYFDLLTSMSNLENARQNRRNASELYKAACGKEKIGTISGSDLMQLRVGLLNANANVLTAENDYLEKMNALKNYLGLADSIEILPVVPELKKISAIGIEDIRRKAYENNPIYDNLKIRLIEAEANVAKMKRERLPDVNLNLSVGTTGSHPTFARTYTHLDNRQVAQIGISIPILDWGKRKGNYIQAKADYELTVNKTEREKREFDEKVRILAENFLDQQELAKIYREAESVAQERYHIALNRFAVGDISVTDLNYAEQEKDDARRNYIYQLYLSWYYYYNLRYITLFDFEKGTDIVYDYEYKR